MQISVNKLLARHPRIIQRIWFFFLFLPPLALFSLFWIPTRQKLGFNHPFACVFAYACCPNSQKNNESVRDGKRERDRDSERWGKYLSALMSSQSSLAGLSILFGIERMRVLLEAPTQGALDLILLFARVAAFALRLAADWWKSLSARRTPRSWRSLSSLRLAWAAAFMASFACLSKLCIWASSRSRSSLAWASSASLRSCRSWTLACRSPRSPARAPFASCSAQLFSRSRTISFSRETIWLCNCCICGSTQRHVHSKLSPHLFEMFVL